MLLGTFGHFGFYMLWKGRPWRNQACTDASASCEYAHNQHRDAAKIIGSDSIWPDVIGTPATCTSQSGTRKYSVKKRAHRTAG